jgi:hypothetical protein
MDVPASSDAERHGSERDALDLKISHHAQRGPAEFTHHVRNRDLTSHTSGQASDT